MIYQDRYLSTQIQKDIERKMVFVGGPRQVGKTTLAKHLLANHPFGYLNWDMQRYFRDVDGREIDFIITENNDPIMAIECKYKDGSISPALKYFKARFPKCDAWQITLKNHKNYLSAEGIRVTHAVELLKQFV